MAAKKGKGKGAPPLPGGLHKGMKKHGGPAGNGQHQRPPAKKKTHADRKGVAGMPKMM